MNNPVFLKIAELVKSGEASLQTGPFGTQLKASDYVEHGVPVINVRNTGFGDIRQDNLEFLNEIMTEKMSAHKLKRGDIVFGRKGAVERHAFIKDIGVGWIQGSDCLRLRINSDRIDNQFVSYFFKTHAHQDWMQAVCSFGATMASLNQDIVKLITIPLPPLDVQRKIAGILSAYDDLIENNKRRIALLENMAEELYREWFVRFRFPGWREAEFEKGIPKGWENKRFDDFCTLQRGYDLPDSDIEPGDFPVVASTSIKAFHKEFKVKPPIVATGRSGSLGTVQFIQKKAWPLNTCLFVKDFKNNSPHLVYFILKAMRLENFNAGAGVPSLNRNHLAALKLAVPEQAIQQKFDEIISPIFKSLAQQAELTENLVKTKNALLPRLISGKLAVEDLAVQLPPSMREVRS